MRKLKLQELNRLSVDAFKEMDKTPIVLVLDNIRSGLNVGSAFRTADAFALSGIALCGITAQPPQREILKTAIGATESVEWTYYPTTEEALRHLKRDGYRVYAVEQTEPSTALQDFKVPENTPLALVFGNEVKGVSE
ncbi:MAG: TrmH family RNA methyltransferase, partial [Phaeodactylibacter sp.]|nr:TrmH family RNA methyltransferase [Phaeodactylibacter sp.]